MVPFHAYPDVCEMLDKEKKQLEDWEARTSFIQELSAAAEVVGSPSPGGVIVSLLCRQAGVVLRFAKSMIQRKRRREREVWWNSPNQNTLK